LFRKGFNLVEVLLVVVIVIILVSVGVKNFVIYQRDLALRSEALRLKEDLIRTEVISVKRGRAKFELLGNEGYQISSKGKIYIRRNLPENMQIGCSFGSTLNFSLGLPDKAGNCKLFYSGLPLEYKVIIDNVSGRIRWKKEKT